MRSVIIVFIFLFFWQDVIPSGDSLQIFKKRKTGLVIGTSIFYAGSNSLLYSLWYKDYQHGKFRVFNDNAEWLQLDKFGHAFSTYQMGWAYMKCMLYAGYRENTSLYAGFLSGVIYMTGIEIMDGFSQGWGFSWGDVCANLSGAGLLVTQEKIWKEQRIQLKFSFLPSTYADSRPELLGKNVPQQIFKDYNGQTYWLSINAASFCPSKNKIPGWLNLAFGFGGNGMISGHENDAGMASLSGFSETKRYRQFYFSLDADLTRVPVKSKWLKCLLHSFNCIKIPFPTIEFSNQRLKGNWF